MVWTEEVHCGARVKTLREREREMATKKAGKRGAAIIVLVVLAALAGGPSAALATPGISSDAPAGVYAPGPDASWVEE